jgi:hypothetical protein|tara:strand:- start:32 stop:523 length:492 start_codon:yes stop_codon:yes gene_type:complete
MSDSNLESKIKIWIKKFILKQKNFKLVDIIQSEDLSKINNEHIKNFKNYSSWCFSPDFTVIIQNTSNEKFEIMLINRTHKSVSLREIGEIMCFNKIINPTFSFLISSKGHSEEISLFMIDDNFNKKLMNYNDKNLVIFAFNDDNENIKKESIIPFTCRNLLDD